MKHCHDCNGLVTSQFLLLLIEHDTALPGSSLPMFQKRLAICLNPITGTSINAINDMKNVFVFDENCKMEKRKLLLKLSQIILVDDHDTALPAVRLHLKRGRGLLYIQIERSVLRCFLGY